MKFIAIISIAIGLSLLTGIAYGAAKTPQTFECPEKVDAKQKSVGAWSLVEGAKGSQTGTYKFRAIYDGVPSAKSVLKPTEAGKIATWKLDPKHSYNGACIYEGSYAKYTMKLTGFVSCTSFEKKGTGGFICTPAP